MNEPKQQPLVWATVSVVIFGPASFVVWLLRFSLHEDPGENPC